MKEGLARLEQVDLREHWGEEAREFTPWLAQPVNLQLLGEAIGIELELVATESSVGAFKADIIAREAGTENKVVIENQLERTDHDHLGKLITYASGHDAKAVVWIAREITEEHRRAVEWLNNVSVESVGFFALEIELWRIGKSPAAPKFNLVCQPNEWLKGITESESHREPTETKLGQLEFWKGFRDYARTGKTFINLRKPRPQHWYSLAVGRAGFHLSLTINTTAKRVGCELYINHRESKVAFTELQSESASIEREVGAKLDWQELPHRHACRILQFRSADIESKETWPDLFAWLKERAEAFHKAFSGRIRALDLTEETEPLADQPDS